MSEVRFKVEFGSARRGTRGNGTVQWHKAAGSTDVPAPEGEAIPQRPPTRVACLLPLAHYVEREIEAGRLTDYAEAARRLGMSRARMSQVMSLRWLRLKTQELILDGKTLTERHLRRVYRTDQEDLLGS